MAESAETYNMKNLNFIITLFILTITCGCHKTSADKSQMVNPIIGDISYENKFGEDPNSSTDNHIRIKTHLQYVENLLRKKDVSGISADLKVNRENLLDLLHTYWMNDVFPKNYDYSHERKPCFMDAEGRICAVGYLIEKSTNRKVANDINKKHKYDELLAMNDSVVDEWILTSGFSKIECAMIQPTYGYSPQDEENNISNSYRISSSIISGLNLSLNTINGIQIDKGSKNKTAQILGLVSGTGQIILGSVKFSQYRNYWGTNNTSDGQKNLSMINIGLGTSTVILSTWNLITNRKPKDKLTTWNLYSIPIENNSNVLAFSLTRNF